MSRSTKKASPKRPAKKSAPKKAAKARKPAAKKKPAVVRPKKKTNAPKSAKSVRSATPVRRANGKRVAGKSNQSLAIIGNHAKSHERRLDPFVRAQKEKLLQLRDAMVDSMAGVAQDTLRARAEGSEASAF